MAVSKEHQQFLEDVFSVVPPISIRLMFGGAGIYHGGTVFALSSDGVIYMKVDDINRPTYEEKDMEPFTYETGKLKKKKNVMKSYYQLPEDALEEPELMEEHCKASIAASLRCKK